MKIYQTLLVSKRKKCKDNYFFKAVKYISTCSSSKYFCLFFVSFVIVVVVFVECSITLYM